MLSPSGLVRRASAWAPVLVSAALAAFAIRIGGEHPFAAAALCLLAATAFMPSFFARRKFRKLLQSGDPIQICAVWHRAFEGNAHAQSTEALMNAVTFAACGWVQEARAQLTRAAWDNIWDPTGEHRLFVETLLEAFDGDRAVAVRLAERVASLPLPPVRGGLRKQVIVLRASLGAFARAFAHVSPIGDLDVLERASKASPLITWAMRYAAAIASVDHDMPSRARALLDGAPLWPPQSAFHEFHAELMTRLATESPAGQRDDR